MILLKSTHYATSNVPLLTQKSVGYVLDIFPSNLGDFFHLKHSYLEWIIIGFNILWRLF